MSLLVDKLDPPLSDIITKFSCFYLIMDMHDPLVCWWRIWESNGLEGGVE